MLSEMRRAVCALVMPVILGPLLIPITACQDHDPLSPVAPRHLRPKLSKTLIDGLAVASPVDINAAGEVLGSIYVGDQSHAAISLNGSPYDLGTLDGADPASTYPMAMNTAGQVVGIQYDGTGTGRGFLWSPDSPNGVTGTMHQVPDGPAGPAQPLDINDAGQILGTYLATGTGIVLWSQCGVVEIQTPGSVAYPRALNSYGQVAGTLYDAGGNAHPFLWTPSAANGCAGSPPVQLDPSGVAWSTASGLNDYGQVILNDSDGNARLWTPESRNGSSSNHTAITLVSQYGALASTRINGRGDVLANGPGPYSPDCGYSDHVFLWRPTTPNHDVGVALDVTPDVGFGSIGWGDFPCSASATLIAEEENGTIQAFGQLTYYFGDTYDQMWSLSGLDTPLAANITWVGALNETYPLTFDGRGTNPYAWTLTYQWDFGDGTSATGSPAVHAYADNGQYTVRLTVSDAENHSNTISTPIVINNVPPTGAFTVTPNPVGEGASYVLRVGNVSDSPADLPTLQLALDCGDGSGYQSVAITGSLTCSAPNDAVRTARAQLRDKDGAINEYTTQITIYDVAPAVTVSGPAGIPDKSTYTISFTFTDPGLLDSWTYSIDWGDGTSSAPVSVTTQGTPLSAAHRYQLDRRGGNKVQTFTVTVRVNDNNGAAGMATTGVVVTGSGAR